MVVKYSAGLPIILKSLLKFQKLIRVYFSLLRIFAHGVKEDEENSNK